MKDPLPTVALLKQALHGVPDDAKVFIRQGSLGESLVPVNVQITWDWGSPDGAIGCGVHIEVVAYDTFGQDLNRIEYERAAAQGTRAQQAPG